MIQKKITETFLPSLAKCLGTKFTIGQSEAVMLLLKEVDAEGITDVRQIAYVLATCWHECRLRSIKEIRAKEGTPVWKMQNKYWPSGYYGRGFCQLTWKKNYQKFSPIIGADLVKWPDMVLNPAIGAKILVIGMARGLFSGVSLGRYFPPNGHADWINARKIVNGTFQADKVAAWAAKILQVLLLL